VEALKNAIHIKNTSPNTEIYILYRDMCAYGFYELYYKKARELGIIFVRYDIDKKPTVKLNDGILNVEFTDILLNKKISIMPDLLVLASAIIPNTEIAQMLKLPVGKDKFFIEAHMKLRPVEFATDGIFLCGFAHSPKFVHESIAQALAASMKALAILTKPTYQAEAFTAFVNTAKCTGCGYCVSVCPGNAIEIVDEKARVNVFLCKCCGLCAAACKNSAITQHGFSEKQLIEQITNLSVA
jgi:heterodisulfide reductase subunit A-like polyferredoxin